MKNRMNSFMKGFIATLKGDDVTAQAEKAWRQAEAAHKVKIGALEGDSIKYEDEVIQAQERLQMARVNNGNPITNRETYWSLIADAKNALTKAEEALKAHQKNLEFWRGEYDALKEEVKE